MMYQLKLILLVFICVTLRESNFSFGQNTVTHSFLNQGVLRDYRVYIPASYDGNTAYPVVFNLHGYTSNSIEQEAYGDFRPIADTAGFLVVHPNGTLDASLNRYWNAFNTPGINDIVFFDALIDTLLIQYNVDPNRIYSCGMSNGGFMSYELACQLGNRIAAVANVTGSMGHLRMAACNAPKPTPAMHIHGTADMTVPYNGNFQFAAIDDVVDYWVNQTNSSSDNIFMQWPDNDPTDGCTAEWYIYLDGDNGSSVELFKVIGGGHTWPGASINIGVTNQDFSASEQIWRFFSQYSLNQLVNIEEQKQAQLSIFPNPTAGIVTIKSDNLITSIKVIDGLGRVIQALAPNQSVIQLELHASGVFILEVETSNGPIRERVIRK